MTQFFKQKKMTENSLIKLRKSNDKIISLRKSTEFLDNFTQP